MCEHPAVYRERVVTARIQHRCCDCRAVIAPGDPYLLCSGVWAGRGAAFKRCIACGEVAEEITAEISHYDDCGPAFGGLVDEVVNRCELDRSERQSALLDRYRASRKQAAA